MMTGGDIANVADAQAADDYSYFNSAQMRNWAGPSHWQPPSRKALRKPGVDDDNTDGNTLAKSRGTREKFLIDFKTPKDFSTAFARSRALTTLSQTTLDKAVASSLTLPDDIHYHVESLTKLFTKPKLKV